MRRIGVIEIGTNSTKFFIARVEENGQFTPIHFAKQTTRIGHGIGAKRRVAPENAERTLRALARFRKASRARGCDGLFAFSTFALRRASNAAAVIRRLERAAGCPVEILTGRQEAQFAYLSARRRLGLRRPHTVLIDIGGGSTELVVARGDTIVHARSLPLGALHLTERFIHSDPIEAGEFAALERHVHRSVGVAFAKSGVTSLEASRCDLVASGGSVASVARMLSEDGAARLRFGVVAALLDRCVVMTLRERKHIEGLEPSRADILPAGLVVVLSCMRHAGKRLLYPNPGGVREGALVHLIANGFQW
jgi:exopolyphosphatase/guanosine-5'-triphosphate,3'-diphosphate pyrophosphatase